MFQKFGYTLPQDLIDAATKISEAKADEPAAPDADAIARRKRLQALKDKQEDDAAETSYKKDINVRKVQGGSYGGAKQKDDEVNEEVEELDEIFSDDEAKAQRDDTIARARQDKIKDNDRKYKNAQAAQKRRALDRAGSAAKLSNEELKGNQHKIDANKNGKIDAHDFKLLKAKKKVEVDEAKDTVTKDTEGKVTSWSHEGDWKKSKGTDGQGKAANLSDIARRKTEKLSKEDIDFIEELNATSLAERELTSGETKEKEHLVKSMKKNKAGFQARYGDKAKSVMYATATKLAKEADLKKETLMGKAGCTSEETKVSESRGHKIIAAKLAQIDRMSTGIAPDHNTNNQSTSDKLKDVDSIKKVQIVTQKDTSIDQHSKDDTDLDSKYKMNKMTHGYGKVQHTEEVEQADEAIRIKDTQGGYNLTKGAGKVAASDRKDAASVVKDFRKSWRAKGLSTKRYDANAQMDRGTGFAATKEEVESIDEISKSQLGTYKFAKGEIEDSKYSKNMSKDQMKQSAHRQSKMKQYGGEHTSKVYSKEEVEIHETATLDKYIKSMGYDPLNMDKNKKVMFAKTNAFKTYAQRSEDSKSPGQEDDVHMSPGATARG